MRIDYSYKFPTFKDAEKEANRIREKVKRDAERKGYAVQMLIGISDRDGKIPSRLSQPHLHIMFYACPCETFLKATASYINKFLKKHNLNGAVTRHVCDTGYIPYIVMQSRKNRYYEHDPDNALSDYNVVKKAKRVEARAFRKMRAKRGRKPL